MYGNGSSHKVGLVKVSSKSFTDFITVYIGLARSLIKMLSSG